MKRGKNSEFFQCNFYTKNHRGQNRSFSSCNFSTKNSRRKDCRGLSTIVVTLVITLLALVAIGIVWGVVRNILTSGSNELGIEQFTTKLDITNAYEQLGNINVVVKRGVGDGTLIKIKFILTGEENSEIITLDSTLEELKSATFLITPLEISSTSVTMVSVAPVIRLSDGTEKLLDITDTYYLNVGGAGSETGGCDPACAVPTPFCVAEDCVECSGLLGCTEDEICTDGACVPIDCVPACGLRVCGLDPICGTSCGDCITGTCSGDGLSCIDCTPQTCLDLGDNCGTPSNGCGGTLDCGTCASGMFCYSGTCTEPILLNEGTVTEIWPGSSGMYFGSPDLPITEGVVNVGDYVSYTEGTECLVIALFRTPVPGYPNSHIGFNFETSIAVGNHYKIWQTLLECQAAIA